MFHNPLQTKLFLVATGTRHIDGLRIQSFRPLEIFWVSHVFLHTQISPGGHHISHTPLALQRDICLQDVRLCVVFILVVDILWNILCWNIMTWIKHFTVFSAPADLCSWIRHLQRIKCRCNNAFFPIRFTQNCSSDAQQPTSVLSTCAQC